MTLRVERRDRDRLVLGSKREPVPADDLREFRHQLGCLLVVELDGKREHGFVSFTARPQRCVESALNKLDLKFLEPFEIVHSCS